MERYDVKGRRYLDYPSKYYAEDVGLRNARLNFRQTEVDHLMENVIYNELIARGAARCRTYEGKKGTKMTNAQFGN